MQRYLAISTLIIFAILCSSLRADTSCGSSQTYSITYTVTGTGDTMEEAVMDLNANNASALYAQVALDGNSCAIACPIGGVGVIPCLQFLVEDVVGAIQGGACNGTYTITVVFTGTVDVICAPCPVLKKKKERVDGENQWSILGTAQDPWVLPLSRCLGVVRDSQ